MTAVTSQDHLIRSNPDWSNAMNLMSAELARVRQQEFLEQAEQDRRVRAMRRVVVARRAQRRAEQAAHRARLALASV